MNRFIGLSNHSILKEYMLRKQIRYNHRNRLCDESVADHSFFVSLFCIKIMEKIDVSVDIERRVLLLATLHDLPEIETSDLPYDVKQMNPIIDNELKKMEDHFFKENFPKYYDILFNKTSNRDTKIVEAIVKLADTYSVKQFCLNEIELGNKSDTIMNILKDAEIRISNRIEILNSLI